MKCKNGTYCPVESYIPTSCPAGYYGTSDPLNFNQQIGCTGCDPGYYSIGNNTCLKCTPGYVCLGNTTRSNPTSVTSHSGYICPKGYYCKEGSSAPTPCPMGTYSDVEGITSQSECKLCGEDSYASEVGQTSCKACGGSSNAVSGSSSCQCIGANRIYLKDTQQCVCRQGYEAGDSSDVDSGEDCNEIIYEKCATDEELDSNGNCRSTSNCTAACDGTVRQH